MSIFFNNQKEKKRWMKEYIVNFFLYYNFLDKIKRRVLLISFVPDVRFINFMNNFL